MKFSLLVLGIVVFLGLSVCSCSDRSIHFNRAPDGDEDTEGEARLEPGDGDTDNHPEIDGDADSEHASDADADEPFTRSGLCDWTSDTSFCVDAAKVCYCDSGSWTEYDCGMVCAANTVSGLTESNGCTLIDISGQMYDWCECVAPADGDADPELDAFADLDEDVEYADAVEYGDLEWENWESMEGYACPDLSGCFTVNQSTLGGSFTLYDATGTQQGCTLTIECGLPTVFPPFSRDLIVDPDGLTLTEIWAGEGYRIPYLFESHSNEECWRSRAPITDYYVTVCRVSPDACIRVCTQYK